MVIKLFVAVKVEVGDSGLEVRWLELTEAVLLNELAQLVFVDQVISYLLALTILKFTNRKYYARSTI